VELLGRSSATRFFGLLGDGASGRSGQNRNGGGKKKGHPFLQERSLGVEFCCLLGGPFSPMLTLLPGTRFIRPRTKLTREKQGVCCQQQRHENALAAHGTTQTAKHQSVSICSWFLNFIFPENRGWTSGSQWTRVAKRCWSGWDGSGGDDFSAFRSYCLSHSNSEHQGVRSW